MLFPNLQRMVRLLYCVVQFADINSANLHTNIGTSIPRIIELLSDVNSGVRTASVNALSKFAAYGKTTLLQCLFY